MKIRSPNQLDALLSIAQVRKRCCFEQDAGLSHSTHWVAYRAPRLEQPKTSTPPTPGAQFTLANLEDATAELPDQRACHASGRRNLTSKRDWLWPDAERSQKHALTRCG